MIFVTVGMSNFRFDRLLGALHQIATQGSSLVIQTGPSAVCAPGAQCHEYLGLEAVISYTQRAECVIAHAGVGSVLLTLSLGKPLIVVPRRKEFGEAIDDHQVIFARRLQDEGLSRMVDDPSRLSDALAEVSSARAATVIRPTRGLSEELGRYLRGRIGAGSASGQPAGWLEHLLRQSELRTTS
jgi:UDP-N-acetylglucosamine transferase subunit ALG13